MIALAGCRMTRHEAAPDLLLVNGTIITVDANDRIAEAIAIRGKRIVAVGTTAAIETLSSAETRRIDLAGRTVTPGLLDAHAHFSPGQFSRRDGIDLSFPAVKSIEDVKRAVAQQAADLAPDRWILGTGWDEGKLAERRLITAGDLDEIAPDRPIWLAQTMGHYGVANNTALRLANIGRNTPDPTGGTIDRDASGNPTGVLKETAQGLVMSLIPPPTVDDIDRGIREMARGFNAECMTGVKDPGIPDENWESYRRVLASGDLSVRAFVLWQEGRTIEDARALIAVRAAMTRPYESTGDDHLIAGGVKLFADGSGGARTA